MNNDLKNILSNSNKDIDNQHLMDYLSNQLSNTESHEIEKKMTDDPFMNDAIEGLQQINDKAKLAGYTEQLNKELKRQTGKNKRHKDKRKWKEQPYTYFAVLLILLLIIICYLVIKQFNH
ncbi:MAG: hypothetical protein V4556_09890 [Bacteroidota bacterium]